MAKAKVKTVVYSNYDLGEIFDEIRKELILDGNETPSEDEVWAEIYATDECDWDTAESELADFFMNHGNKWIVAGDVDRWNGTYGAYGIFETLQEFWKLRLDEDCDYMEFYDENGTLHFNCTHHDGTNNFVIKQLTDEGFNYYENWSCGWFSNDKRSEAYIVQQIMKYSKYSKQAKFAEKMYR